MNGCAFCDRKNFESRIIHETDEFFVVATLGQITDGGYLLIIPKKHVDCIANLDGSEVEAFCTLVDLSCDFVEREYNQGTAMFEHGIVGQTVKHAHWHIFPGKGTDKMTERIRRDFPLAEIDCIGIYTVLFDTSNSGQREPYLFWETENGMPFVCWNPQEVPPQYLRIVVAGLLGRPERANWRTMDPELDKKLVAETVARLKPYFV